MMKMVYRVPAEKSNINCIFIVMQFRKTNRDDCHDVFARSLAKRE